MGGYIQGCSVGGKSARGPKGIYGAYTSQTEGERVEPVELVLYDVLLQVPVLVTPLGHDAEGVLKEGDDDEEATNCW